MNGVLTRLELDLCVAARITELAPLSLSSSVQRLQDDSMSVLVSEKLAAEVALDSRSVSIRSVCTENLLCSGTTHSVSDCEQTEKPQLHVQVPVSTQSTVCQLVKT